ncbi:TIGR04104 family putative zinc finger protein [Halobacillus halophilus]|uniref:TIGR04104 family putative zinc finger protein n=1 Tax=Halobacillus halophilus TaxID=1570 RepID=UPI00136B465A|nr:TIGR04104 family putative zinc finger protein [Halobacillus halophilus]
MPVCRNCGNEWFWKDTQRLSIRRDRGAVCQFCGEKQFQSRKSMRKVSLFHLLPSLVLPFALVMDVSIVSGLALLFTAEAVFLSAFPWMVELTNQEEPIW